MWPQLLCSSLSTVVLLSFVLLLSSVILLCLVLFFSVLYSSLCYSSYRLLSFSVVQSCVLLCPLFPVPLFVCSLIFTVPCVDFFLIVSLRASQRGKRKFLQNVTSNSQVKSRTKFKCQLLLSWVPGKFSIIIVEV